MLGSFRDTYMTNPRTYTPWTWDTERKDKAEKPACARDQSAHQADIYKNKNKNADRRLWSGVCHIGSSSGWHYPMVESLEFQRLGYVMEEMRTRNDVSEGCAVL